MTRVTRPSAGAAALVVMAAQSGNAPSWLFSFVDLAFLLLIAMTQLGGGPTTPDFGEIVVPRIHDDVTAPLSAHARALWQLRVHPPAQAGTGPFELAPGGSAAVAAGGMRMGASELRNRLAELRDAATDRPLLAPHEDSRSRDLLDAVALIEEFWPGRRRAAVEPVLARR